MRTIAPAILVIAAVPAAVWFGHVLLPSGGDGDLVRYSVLALVLFPSLGLFFGWLYLRLRKPTSGLKLILLGTLFRLTLLLAVGLWLRAEHPDLERAGLLFYLVTTACFLFFELVAVISFRLGFEVEVPPNETGGRQDRTSEERASVQNSID